MGPGTIVKRTPRKIQNKEALYREWRWAFNICTIVRSWAHGCSFLCTCAVSLLKTPTSLLLILSRGQNTYFIVSTADLWAIVLAGVQYFVLDSAVAPIQQTNSFALNTKQLSCTYFDCSSFMWNYQQVKYPGFIYFSSTSLSTSNPSMLVWNSPKGWSWE